MSKKRMIVQIMEIVGGIILLGLGVTGKLDEFWSGMGGALMAVGLLRVIQHNEGGANKDLARFADQINSDSALPEQ